MNEICSLVLSICTAPAVYIPVTFSNLLNSVILYFFTGLIPAPQAQFLMWENCHNELKDKLEFQSLLMASSFWYLIHRIIPHEKCKINVFNYSETGSSDSFLRYETNSEFFSLNHWSIPFSWRYNFLFYRNRRIISYTKIHWTFCE